MYQTPRVAAITLAALLATLPAQTQTHSTLSVKAWETKSDEGQLAYLGFAISRLVLAVNNTDKPLADKIHIWYSHKEPGQKFTEGTLALLTSVFTLEKKARNDRSVDLSRIDIEDVVMQTTEKKFSLPAIACREAGGRACAGERSALADAGGGSGTGPGEPVEHAAPVPPESEPPAMATFVAEDVHEFLSGAADGFESYRSGPVHTRPQDGLRWWDSSRKPLLADHCEIQQQHGGTAYFCVLYKSPDKSKLAVHYNDLISAVVAALPEGWTMTPNPFTGVVDSKGFTSSDGTSGQIWMVFDENIGQYTLNFQIVSNTKQ
jgi:hypothetical protein